MIFLGNDWEARKLVRGCQYGAGQWQTLKETMYKQGNNIAKALSAFARLAALTALVHSSKPTKAEQNEALTDKTKNRFTQSRAAPRKAEQRQADKQSLREAKQRQPKPSKVKHGHAKPDKAKYSQPTPRKAKQKQARRRRRTAFSIRSAQLSSFSRPSIGAQPNQEFCSRRRKLRFCHN